jgi:hypothetical protein
MIVPWLTAIHSTYFSTISGIVASPNVKFFSNKTDRGLFGELNYYGEQAAGGSRLRERRRQN